MVSTPPNVHKPLPISHASPTPASSTTYSSTSFPPNPNPLNGGGVVNGVGSGEMFGQNGLDGRHFHQHQRFQSDADMLDEPYEPLARSGAGVPGLQQVTLFFFFCVSCNMLQLKTTTEMIGLYFRLVLRKVIEFTSISTKLKLYCTKCYVVF
jgi:hypothetical protein